MTLLRSLVAVLLVLLCSTTYSYADGQLDFVDTGPNLLPTVLTSTSTTACTSISSGPVKLFKVWNTGPALTVYIQFYNDPGTSCANSALIYGDGSTITLGAGQILTFDVRLSGLAYKINSALPSGTNVIITTGTP